MKEVTIRNYKKSKIIKNIKKEFGVQKTFFNKKKQNNANKKTKKRRIVSIIN